MTNMLRNIKSKISLNTILWIAVLSFLGYRIWPQLGAALGVGSGGTDAPEFTLQTLDGETVSLAGLRGQVVLVNFWATWCPPCRAEMPGFQRVYEASRDRGFTILGLSTDVGGRAPVDAFLAEHGITYPVAMASSKVVRDFGGANMLPTSFLLDRQGRIRHTVKGFFAEATLSRAVERLLAEPAESTGPEQPAAATNLEELAAAQVAP
jgi:peroxiredoxin